MTARIQTIARGTNAEWRDNAACRKHDPELWFAHGTGRAPTYNRLDRAKKICAGCPVVAHCLADAMDREGGRDAAWRDGIRGGLTPTERYQLYRRTVRKEAA